MNWAVRGSNPAAARAGARRRILVVEDDADIGRQLRSNLRDQDFDVDIAGNAADGLEFAQNGDYHLLVLDRMLPDLDGLEICTRLRAQGSTVPILMLTARTSDSDRVLVLELGADDYLTRPFSILELQARIKAILRRVELARADARGANEVIEVDRLRIDVCGRQVSVGARPLELTAKEFDLLLHFARHPGRVYSRAQLLDNIWGYSHGGYEHTVNTHINRLRKKMESGSGGQGFIETVWGVGYRFRGLQPPWDAR